MSPLIASAGPIQGVRYALDEPYVDARQYILTGKNGYFRDAESSWLARPGFTNTNPSAQIGTGQRTQGTTAYVDPTTNTVYRFFAVNGKLYRSDATFTTFTDVSPVGISIDNGATTRVSFVGVGAALVVTDGVNKPWIMSAYASTPVTGTYINYDGAGGAWSTWGEPTIYQDCVMFITKTVPAGKNAVPRVSFVWSEPNQPGVGYEQTGYANYWNMIQTATDPLYVIWGTNDGLFAFRQNAIEVAAGTPSINFSSTATRSARGDAVGSVSPWAVAQYKDIIYFLDARGRPWRMSTSGNPEPIWEQLTGLTSGQSAAAIDPTIMSYLPVGCIVPELNQYLVGIWSSNAGTSPTPSPSFAQVFDAATGSYGGQWQVSGGVNGGIGLDVLDVQIDATGTRVLCAGGGPQGSTGLASGGYVWILNSLNAGVWADTGGFNTGGIPSVTTGRMGYAASRNLYPDYANFIVRSSETMASVRAFTSYENYSVSSIVPVAPSGGSSVTGEYRATMGLDGTATRYLMFLVNAPTAPQSQWGFIRADVFGSTSAVGADEA